MTPEIGMGATYTVWTDRVACTIIAIRRNGSELVLQADKQHRADGNGMSECQTYLYETDQDGDIYRVSRRVRADGTVTWKKIGHRTNSAGFTAVIGVRAAYHDYSF